MGGWALILGSWGGGTDNTVPSVPGIEVRALPDPLQWRIGDSPLHFASKADDLDYRLEAERLQYAVKIDPLHWSVDET